MKQRRSPNHVRARAASESAEGPRRQARRWSQLVLLLALLVPGAGPLPPRVEPRALPETPPGAPPALATLTLSTVPPARASVTAWAGDRIVAQRSGQGALVLELPRDEALLLRIDASGHTRVERELTLVRDASLEIALAPGSRVAGRTLDQSGAPLAGVRVEVRAAGFTSPWNIESDADGRFLFDTLPPEGPFELAARHRGYSESRQAVLPGQPELEVRLARVSRIAGRVIAPDGSAAGGAEVQIAGSGLWPARVLSAGTDGRFALEDIRAGVYEVRAHLNDWVAEPRRGLTVEAGDQAFVTLALTEGVTLSGIVVDSTDGTPLREAEVAVAASTLETAPRRARTDDEGRFEVRGLLETPHRVSAAREGFVPARDLEWEPGRPLRIALDPGAVLAGVVIDEERRPIEGARIEVGGDASDAQPIAMGPELAGAGALTASLEGSLPGALEVVPGPVPTIPAASEVVDALPSLPTAAGFYSDASGRFRVSGIAAGRVQLVASRRGYATSSTGRLFLAPGQLREGVELVLPPSGTLAGRVVDGRGDGVPGAPIEVRSDREAHPRIAFTEPDGRFEIEDVVGELSVTAAPPGWPPVRGRVAVPPGGRAETLLALPSELSTLRARTVDERGFPLADVQVSVSTLRSDMPLSRTGWSGPDGTLEVLGLPAPPWRITAHHPERAALQVDLAAAERETRLVLPLGSRVTGQALDERTGDPLAGVEIVLVREDLPPERLEARTDSEGRSARWSIQAREQDHAPASVDVEVDAPRDLALEPLRLVPTGRLVGTVLDVLGNPVARARVTTAAAPEPSTVTDGEGRFTLRGVPPGLVQLVGAHPGAGEGQGERVRVWAGQETSGLVVRLPERLDQERAGELEARRRGVALQVEDEDGGVLVSSVIQSSRAARAGLRQGDRLESVDGRACTSARQTERLLRGPVGVPAVLEVARGARRAVLVVDREAWAPE